MAKSKKPRVKTHVFNEKPNLDGLNKLKLGDIVLYKTNVLIDKCSVESIDKKSGTCKLSNGVEVSRGILSNGSILRLGRTPIDTVIRVWDEECEIEFEYFKSKHAIKQILERINKSTDKPGVVKVVSKLNKLMNKYGL